MYKLGHFAGGRWGEHSHSPIYCLEKSGDGVEKVVATVPGGDPTVFRTLLEQLNAPLFLLYLLHTPRGEEAPGRYQSPELATADADLFLTRFARFLKSDARFDLWAHSPADKITVVWDRHNLIYTYGPSIHTVATLQSLGFREGKPFIPSPHEHHYYPDLDREAEAVLSYYDWSFSPLRPGDEQ